MLVVVKGASVLSASGDKSSGNAKVIYAEAGDYTATLTLSNGWGSDTKTIEVVSVQPTGIEEEVAVEEMMKAFPNPFENEVYLNFAEDGVYTVELYDNAGRISKKTISPLISHLQSSVIPAISTIWLKGMVVLKTIGTFTPSVV